MQQQQANEEEEEGEEEKIDQIKRKIYIYKSKKLYENVNVNEKRNIPIYELRKAQQAGAHSAARNSLRNENSVWRGGDSEILEINLQQKCASVNLEMANQQIALIDNRSGKKMVNAALMIEFVFGRLTEQTVVWVPKRLIAQ